jgi:hypothetical protein
MEKPLWHLDQMGLLPLSPSIFSKSLRPQQTMDNSFFDIPRVMMAYGQ